MRPVLDQGSAHVGAGLDLVLHELEQHNGVGGHREIEQHGDVDDHNIDQHQQADEPGRVERMAGHRQGDEGALITAGGSGHRITTGTSNERNRTTMIR